MQNENQIGVRTDGRRSGLRGLSLQRFGVVRTAFALALFGIAGRADVIYTNFDPANSNKSSPAIPIAAGTTGRTAAQSFTPVQDYLLGSITLALSVPQGETGATFTVAIMNDSGSGSPGSVIEQFTVTSPPISSTPVIPIVVNSVKNPTLTAYTQYWVAIAPADSNIGYWQTNTTSDIAGSAPDALTLVSTTGLTGPWDTAFWFGQPRGAFSVSGNPTTGPSAPSVTSLVPSTIAAGSPAFTMTVNGNRFLTGATVLWNGTALTTTLLSDTQVTANVPATLIANTGVATVAVRNSDGSTSNTINFTVTALPQFAISTLSPMSVVAGAASFTLTISGKNFLSGATVHFGSTTLTPVSVTASQIQVTVPAALVAAAGTQSVTVVQSSQTSNALTFTVRSAAVTISTLIPSSVVLGGPNMPMLINGAGYTADATVLFGGVTLTPSLVTSTQIIVTVPAALVASLGTPSVVVTEASGASNAVTFIIGEAAGQPLAIASSTLLPVGKVGAAYTGALIGTGGAPPYTWTLNNSTLPAGLTLAASGAITGTPTASGYTSFSAKVTDTALASAVGSFVMYIAAAAPAGSITTGALLPSGTVGVPYTLTMAATGGTPPYVWTLSQSTLPAGLSLSNAGVLSGTPTAAASSSFTIQVTDSAQVVWSKTFTLAVAPAVSSQAAVLSHFASGGGWDSSIYLVNTTASAVSVDVKFVADDGTPLTQDMSVTLGGATNSAAASEVTETIPPGATLLIEVNNSTSTVSSSGWVQVSSAGTIKGYAAFHYSSTNGAQSAATVPLESAFSSSFLMPYDGTGGLQTGVALANLASTQTATINATILDEFGHQIGTGSVTLPAGGHIAFMLSDKFAATTANRGTILFSSAASTNITGLGLRVYPTGGFTSIPKLQ